MSVELFRPSDDPESGNAFQSNSFSGGERNRLFLRRHDNYKDMSLVSGLDFREDSRGFVIFDYDNDGWLDIAVTSPNYPRLRMVRNRMGEGRDGNPGFVDLILVGGQTTAEPSTEWSSRDAYGATVVVTMGDEKRMFQLSCGEGLSHQNAKRIHVGTGQSPQVDKIEVHWPSGKQTVMENVATGGRITIHENPASTTND